MFSFNVTDAVSQASKIGKPIIQFKAGKCNMVGTMVTADVRKGTVTLVKSPDNLMHFCWEERYTRQVNINNIPTPF